MNPSSSDNPTSSDPSKWYLLCNYAHSVFRLAYQQAYYHQSFNPATQPTYPPLNPVTSSQQQSYSQWNNYYQAMTSHIPPQPT